MKKLLFTLLMMVSSLTFANQLTIVVPFPAGGDTDVLARIFATKYREMTGTPVVVENRVGASGIIGFNYISKAPNDGTVIGLVPSTFVTAPFFFPAAKYDPLNDFSPIMQLSGHGFFLFVNSDTGIKSVKDLVEANKQGKVKAYGSPGVATPQNILGEMFNNNAKTSLTHIPFKGNSEVITNMLNKTVDVSLNTMLPFIPHVESGKISVIGVASAQRSPLYPNVPTLAEQGVRGIEFESWLGFVGPKGMSSDKVNELNKTFNEIINQPDVQERLKKLAMSPVGSSPQVFINRIQNNQNRFNNIANTLNIKVE